MALKFFILAILAAVSQAVVIAPAGPYPYGPAIAKYAAPLAPAYPAYGPAVAKVAAPIAVAAKVADDYDPNPQYSYAYDIHDALTGDTKSQQETRQGDVVQGSYSLVEPDGTRRIVEYAADPVNGFNAVVHKEPLAAKVVAAPAIAKVAAPLSYAPVAKIASPYGPYGPVAKIAAPALYPGYPGLYH